MNVHSCHNLYLLNELSAGPYPLPSLLLGTATEFLQIECDQNLVAVSKYDQ